MLFFTTINNYIVLLINIFACIYFSS